jgi:hypothetical protein
MLSEQNWNLGSICGVDEEVNLEKSALIAEVYTKATHPDDGGFIACYFLVHDLEREDAERAMLFFSSQASLLVDVARLTEDAGAESPALVTIRYTPSVPEYLAAAVQWDFLRTLPDEHVVSREGWQLFCVNDALGRGMTLEEACELPPFDYRALRRKVYANRAVIEDDRNPWLKQELDAIKEVTKNSPEGSETFVALAEDMEAALNSEVQVGDRYSIIIPTKIQRNIQKGAVPDWIAQTGREIVVAHGLDALQAARALKIVSDDPDKFVSKSELLSGVDAREVTFPPLAIPDRKLNWISTDFSGRRNHQGYEHLRSVLGQVGQNGFSQSSPELSLSR